MKKLARSLPARSRLTSLLVAVATIGLLLSSAGLAAASPTDGTGPDDHPVDGDEIDHQRGEHYDGGNSSNAYGGLAAACDTPASQSPEGDYWCRA